MSTDSEKKHRLRINLYPNLLTEDPNDYSARIISERTLSVRDVCTSAIKRGGAPSTIDAMELNVNQFLKEMLYQMSDGFAINTLYFTASAVIRGSFKGPLETFDPKRHTISFRYSQGEASKRITNDVEVQVLGVANTSPYIASVYDVKSGSISDLLTPRQALKIGGGKLKVGGDHADIGVYFVAVDSRARTRVPDNEVITNKPSELTVLIPDLPPGGIIWK